MSLILRDLCQSFLDDVGLQNYHVEIAQNKQLTIVGECGQTLVTIKGVTFSRFAPTKEEINISMPLFNAFLVKHIKTLKEYVATKEELQKLPSLEEVKKKIKGLDHFDSGNYHNSIIFKNENTKIEIFPNGKIAIEGRNTFKDYVPYTFSTKDIKAINEWLVSCEERENLKAKLLKLQETVYSCTI